MRSEFLFKLLDGRGPADRLSRLSIIGDVVAQGGVQGSGTDNMMNCKCLRGDILNRAGGMITWWREAWKSAKPLRLLAACSNFQH